MNREYLKKAFDNYAALYDINEPKIKLKYDHTYQVAELSDRIAKAEKLSESDVDIAWTIGLLHDIGRFEQVVRYGTYRDAISVDHAQFGADLLFNDGLIEKFGIEDKEVLHLIEVAIRNHNVFKLPENLNERELLFSKLIRDADKIDIMRANVEFPLEEICNVTTEELYSATVEQSTIEAFLRHETIVRGKNMGVADGIMNQIAFIFALEFPISLKIMVERGHIFQLMEFHSKNPDTEAKFELARQEVRKYIDDNGLGNRKNNIKLVASDLDGTLLPEGTKDINPEIYTVVRQLKEKGIIFVPASGRELPTMRTVIEPIKDDVYFIANNGGVISKGVDEVISVLALDWEAVKAIVSDVKKDPDCAFVSFNTIEGTYTDSTNIELIEWLKNGYGMNPIIVPDMLAEEKPAIKISVFVNVDAGLVAPDYIKKYGMQAHVTAAGANWVDFTHSQADKGIAFNRLIKKLGIKKEETWAFGDNENDISMLKAAGCGFAAPDAREAVKMAADECLQGNIWDSVILKLKELL